MGNQNQKCPSNQQTTIYFDLADQDLFVNFHDHIESEKKINPNLVTKLTSSSTLENHESLIKCLVKNHLIVKKLRHQ